MDKSKIKILINMKSQYHEMILSKEINARIENCQVVVAKTKTEALKLISSTTFEIFIADVSADVLNDCCQVHKIHNIDEKLPIIAIVENTTEEFFRKLQGIGVSEILINNESSYVVVPRLIKELLSKNKRTLESRNKETPVKQSEHLKMTSRTLSHEINNPLMSILGLTELILDDKFQYDRELIQKIIAIQKSALRIQETTHRLVHITSPVYQKTPNGMMINPKKSRIYTKSKVILDETE